MTALGFSVLAGILSRVPLPVVVFDFGRGVRELAGWPARVSLAGAMRTRRWYRPESHAAISASLATPLNFGPSVTALRTATVLLDISAGDSFTTLYGLERFQSVAWSKRAALKLHTPLILLPQTYGPFDDATRTEAARLVRGAAQCWARDERSFEILQDLLGPAFDPLRHRHGVDVAFLLEQREPQDGLRAWEADADGPLAALNVSGLIFNDPAVARGRYRLRADYTAVMRSLVQGLIDEGARVLLVPHVVAPRGHHESDTSAIEAIAGGLNSSRRRRLSIAPQFRDPREIKWVIARSDWFCGTRLHATIAAMSSGVPSCAVAYSDKALGVFATCGQASEVVDPRHADTDEVVERVLDSFRRREALRASLRAKLPAVLEHATQQMDEIARAVRQFGRALLPTR